MQNNSPMPSGSIIEPQAQPAFTPAAPGNAPLNPGAPLTSDARLPDPAGQKKSHGAIIQTILLVIMSLVAAVFIWLFIQKYMEWKSLSESTDAQIDSAVAIAVADNTTKMEAEFAEREKSPYEKFTGPEDYGRFSFEYPKTWSVYISKDAVSGGDFEAYFNPVEVSPITSASINALHMQIRNAQFDSVVGTYDSGITSGKLTLRTETVGGVLANIYTGEISTDRRGAIMVLKLRDKTVILRTDAEIFLDDFYRVLSTVTLVE